MITELGQALALILCTIGGGILGLAGDSGTHALEAVILGGGTSIVGILTWLISGGSW